jgi:class 3 adenylate cyclase
LKIANKFIKCLGERKTPSYKGASPPDATMDLHRDNIDQLLEARSEIDKELRRHKSKVTIFFTDVVGSTTYFDRFGDTAGLILLHRHDSLVTSAVEKFRGMVVKKIGDSVMAEFPEPVLGVRRPLPFKSSFSCKTRAPPRTSGC